MKNPILNLNAISAICQRIGQPALALAAVFGLALATAPAQAQAPDFEFSRVLHSFAGPPADGLGAGASELVADAQGNLYGTTSFGGAFSLGTVYKLDSSGNETVLYSFTGTKGDGANPRGPVVLDSKGSIYGSTYYGGNLSCGVSQGCGTIFKLSKQGHEKILHSFAGGAADGANPSGALAMDKNGNLYGTTSGGGVNFVGTAFKITPAGVETVLHTFTCCAYGDGPSGLIIDAAGNLYGTSPFGGTGSGPKDVCGDFGCGTLYKLAPDNSLTVLHNFAINSDDDGAHPNPGLVMDADGNLYGTTYDGGFSQKSRFIGGGIVFKVDPLGNETILYQFCVDPVTKNCPDGVWPTAGLARDSAGNLYGTTSGGGASGDNGTVFLLDPTSTYSVLATFRASNGGAYVPATGAVLDTEGDLYLVTAKGGADNGGAVFGMLTPAAETEISVTSSLNPSTSGQPVTFTAAVTTTTGVPNNGEVVTFSHGKTILGTGILSGGSATFTTSALAVGSATITAAYPGDTHHAGSSGAVKQVVKKTKE
jgi:uncharacterized repeat protein (TIGR03803 family)